MSVVTGIALFTASGEDECIAKVNSWLINNNFDPLTSVGDTFVGKSIRN